MEEVVAYVEPFPGVKLKFTSFLEYTPKPEIGRRGLCNIERFSSSTV
jgi:hypothetical protein